MRFIFLAFFLFFSCAPKESPSQKRLIPVDPATAGSIRGVVRFEGAPPAPSRIVVSRFPECANPRTEDEDVLIEDGLVQNVFVFIKSGLEGFSFPPPEGEVVLDQKNCLYAPRIFGLRVGQTLAIKNNDEALHNVHALPKLSRSFNVGMNPKALPNTPTIRKTFEETEVMVALRCDVHPWMHAYAGVLPHPYFAVTGVDGAFELNNVPPGQYVLAVWHERLGMREIPVTLGAKEDKVENLQLF